MFINYDENELTQLFGQSPIDIYEKESGMFIYSFTDSNKIEMVLNVSIYSKTIDFSLNLKAEPVFSVKLTGVEWMKVENHCLLIHTSSGVDDMVICFIPNISVTYQKCKTL